MPFPPVDGHTFQENAADLIKALEDQMGRPFSPLVKQPFVDLFMQVQVVADQLYDDVQRLKRLASDHGWEIETDDPSQKVS